MLDYGIMESVGNIHRYNYNSRYISKVVILRHAFNGKVVNNDPGHIYHILMFS